MSRGAIRSALVAIIFFGYVAIVFVLIGCWFLGGFDFDEFTTSVAVILPIVGAHVGTVVSFSQNNIGKDKDDADTVRSLSASIALSIPIAFLTLMLFAIIAKAFHETSITFEQFKILLAVVNSMFGAYVATLVTIYLKGTDGRKAEEASGPVVETKKTPI